MEVVSGVNVKQLLKTDNVFSVILQKKLTLALGWVLCRAAGEMVHYLNGKPVAQYCSGSSMVIHSHKNCTEWAPDVSFQNDTAINLVAELSRSQRIKCSCCGLKGAALGCYEKSCHKGFHVPCAKLMSQCRWDTLCPLHVSSKLPNEVSECQERRKKHMSKEE